MTDSIATRTLQALFCLCRDNRPVDAASLARALGVTATRVGTALVQLERDGLVDASRARLTMEGLARAVSRGTDMGGAGLDLEAEASETEAELPVAARSELPPARIS